MLTSAGVTLFFGLKQQARTLKIIILYIFISFSADLIFWTALKGFDVNIIRYTGPIFRLLELTILLEYYGKVLEIKTSLIARRILQLSLLLCFPLLFDLTSTPIRTTSTIVFSLLATSFFLKMITEMKVTNPLRYPLFWVNSAFLVYFSGSVFLTLFFDSLARLHEISAVLSYIFHNTLGLTKNILIAIAFWISLKNPEWEQYVSLAK